MKELPVMLMLAPIGYDTLATRIWKATEDVYFAEAALHSLAMVLVCGSLILMAIRRGGSSLSLQEDEPPGPVKE
jgi:iron(III) transport system permease protein